MFGGKGKSVAFYPTGDELFDVMRQLERDMNVSSFFVMDENFLLHRKRALRLLELMRKHDKAWSLYVFSSANVLRSYTIEQLVGLGVSWVWMGIEGCNSRYVKLQGIDTFELVRELQSHGIRVLGSTIIGLENHTPENIDEAIDYAARHDTDFHQFMLYTPIPGTPLHAELEAKGLMKPAGECDPGDIHGQLIFNYRHPHIPAGMEGEFMIRAFDGDFHRNGPSVVRIVRTTLAGWKRHKNHPDARIRRRYAWEARELATTFSAVVGGVKLYYRNQPEMHAKMSAVLDDLHREFGWKSRLFSAAGQPLRALADSPRREALGVGLELRAADFYEKNDGLRRRRPGPLPRCDALRRPPQTSPRGRTFSTRPARMKRAIDRSRQLWSRTPMRDNRHRWRPPQCR